MKRYIILFVLGVFSLVSCNTYSTLSFDNQSQSSVTLVYIQENGKNIEQEIRKKEDLNMMFNKRWSDDYIKKVVSEIKSIGLYYKSDTIFYVSEKQEMFELFKSNRSNLFKDRVTFKIK